MEKRSTKLEEDSSIGIQRELVYNTIRESAREALKRKQFVDALELNLECLRLDKVQQDKVEESNILLNIGRCLHYLHANELAVEFFKRAEKAHPTYHKPKMCRGIILQEKEKYGGAIDSFKKALRCLSKNAGNMDKKNLDRAISITNEHIANCERRMERTSHDPNDKNLRLQRLPVFDIIPDLKIIFDCDPQDNEQGKPLSNEQPLLHRILDMISSHYPLPAKYANMEKQKDFLFSEENRIRFLKKLPKLCRERRRVLSELCHLSTDSLWVEWTVRIFNAKMDLFPNHKIIVVFADDQVENFHLCKSSVDLSEEINTVLRLTIIRSLNSLATWKAAPAGITICVGESVDMDVVSKGMCASQRPEDKLDIEFGVELPELDAALGLGHSTDAGWSAEILV